MKHTHFKNIIRGAAAGILLLIVGIGIQVSAAATPPTNQQILDNRYLTTQGNSSNIQQGLLDIFQLELAPKTLQTASSLGSTTLFNGSKNIIFRLVGTSFFDNIMAYGDAAVDKLFVGYTAPPSFTAGDPVLQVDGTIKIEALADTSAADYEQLCTDDFGRLLRCSGGETAEGGTNGSCGSSNGGTFSTAPSTNLCSAGTASSVSDNTGGGSFGTNDYTWTCAGTGGGSTASCSANYAPSTTEG
ncbi:MAG: hypothetical protein ACJAV6_000286 [Candidatus Paceibacteria bacterium]|jgi:hypothetical protein